VNQDAHDHATHSSLREGVLEHLVVGALLRALWLAGCRDFELLRPQTDAAGYDVVLTAYGVTRHIQLKSTVQGGAAARQSLNVALERHPSACVLWSFFEAETMALGSFLWFGEAPGTPLDLKGLPLGKHTKPSADGSKAERPNIRKLRKADCLPLHSIDDVLIRLFGPQPSP
jgi:hypothetical protein